MTDAAFDTFARDQEPFQVWGISLERRGERIEVDVQLSDRTCVTVISEYDPYIPGTSPPHSHHVTAGGIRHKVVQATDPEALAITLEEMALSVAGGDPEQARTLRRAATALRARTEKP